MPYFNTFKVILNSETTLFRCLISLLISSSVILLELSLSIYSCSKTWFTSIISKSTSKYFARGEFEALIFSHKSLFFLLNS